MNRSHPRAFALLLSPVFAMCCLLAASEEPPVTIESGVSARLADERAQRISALSYDLRLSVPEDPAAPLEGQVTLRFDLADAATQLLIDFAQPAQNILAVSRARAPVDYAFDKEHVIVPAAALTAGPNELTLTFRAAQDAVNRNPDYLFTLFVPDRARRAFPLFDQPDLKARYALTLDIPAAWMAMSNAELESENIDSSVESGRKILRFAATDPIPSYLFSFVAGEFSALTRTLDGRRMTMLHRETDADKLARNLDDIFAIHAQSLDWLETYTGIDYPFSKFGFALIPDFPYGGMEHVGAIQYRASSLLLDESPSENQRLNRAQLIAHETAHMWFGNLVTMRWFNDVWTKEVFANFMADKIVNPQFPDTDHELNFVSRHYPAAYGVDRTAGANPIRQRLDNLNLAGQMYGPIIYHKAPIMMRQLERLLGEEPFRQGMHSYLSRYAYGNATWPALIEILDDKTPIDLAAWSEVWVNSAGMPEFRLAQNPDATGSDAPWSLHQVDPRGEAREWPQAFSALAIESGDEADILAARENALPASFQNQPRESILFNANGLGYGRFPTDPALFGAWEKLSSLQRGVLLVNAFEDLITPPLGDPGSYVDTLLPILASETNELVIDLAADQLRYAYFSLLTQEQRQGRREALESTLWTTMLNQDSPSMTKVFFELFAGLSLSDSALTKVYRVWSNEQMIDQLTLHEAERIRLAALLAVRLPDKADAIIERQLQETRNPDRLRRLRFTAPALSPSAATRDAFFASLKQPENRATEVWVSSALRWLNDPTRIEHAVDYVLPSLALLEEIQVTGDIFFPSAWLNAALGRHNSAQAAKIVREFLAERPDYNPQLRMKILQAADPLFRASDIQATGN